MQTHIPKICSDFLQNHIDKRMFEIYNKFTVKEQMFENICFKSMGGIYYDERIQRKDNCYTKHSQKCTPRKMSYQKNKMQTSPFCQYVFDLSGNSFHTPFYQRRCKCRNTSVRNIQISGVTWKKWKALTIFRMISWSMELPSVYRITPMNTGNKYSLL